MPRVLRQTSNKAAVVMEESAIDIYPLIIWGTK